ncbi:MAG: DUF5985 family protein [Caulobacteraceae bacterium]
MSGAAPIYLLCAAASLACAFLLARARARARTQLLLWTAVCFAFFALNNLLLVADMLIFTRADLLPLRQAAAALGLVALLYGFIREAR